MNTDTVLIYNKHCTYPSKQDNFRPSVNYPENPFPGKISLQFNVSYDSVRNAFKYLKLDEKRFNTEYWNPLKKYIKPGDRVVIKPNLVLHKNYRQGYNNDTECVFTHPSIVAAIIDYVIIALKGAGQIIVGDAPVQECDFETLVSQSGYSDLIQFYQTQGINIELKDFRGLKSVSNYGVLHQSINADAKCTIVNLNELSEFAHSKGEKNENVRITNYTPSELLSHHYRMHHEYCISSYILDADVIINVPKPKTHKKAGITGALKNLVGINCRKEYLPHHTVGDISIQGDEYREKSFLKSIRSGLHDSFCNAVNQKKYFFARYYQIAVFALDLIVSKLFKDTTSWGSWYGNNTISKTTIDLNKILLFADKQGVMQTVQQRNILTVCDMIISGEHNGPMAPASKEVGVVIAGENPVFIDELIAHIMGADITKIPTLMQAHIGLKPFNPHQIKIISNDLRWNNKKIREIPNEGIFYFKSPDDWEPVFYREK